MIETRALSKSYGRQRALDALDLRIERGEIFGFLGPNGAGKTTTIRILATLLAPSSGRAEIDGVDVTSGVRTVRRLVGYMPDVFGVYETLSVEEYLVFFAAAYDVPRREIASTIGGVLELTGLESKRDALAGALSRGMQQRLGLARTLVHDPQVLLLDEPASGLDPRARVEVREIIRELGNMGKTILLSSHILSDIAEICTSVGIIEEGVLKTQGPLDEVLGGAGGGRVLVLRVEGEQEALAPRLAAALPEPAGFGPAQLDEKGFYRVPLTGAEAGAAEAALRLVEAGLRVLHLEEERADLERAYMSLTEGRVS